MEQVLRRLGWEYHHTAASLYCRAALDSEGSLLEVVRAEEAGTSHQRRSSEQLDGNGP